MSPTTTDIAMIEYQETGGIGRKLTEIRTASENLKLTKLQRLEFVFAVINRLLIGFVTFYLCWMCLRLKVFDEIPWHAILCTIGFVCLMSEGLSAHYRGNAWAQRCNRPEKTQTHWILQLCGAILGTTGIVIKIDLEEQHFHTTHGILGLATLLLLLFSLISGLSSLYAYKLRKQIQPFVNKTLHTVLGLGTYLLSILSMYFSFETDIFLEYSLDAASNVDFCLLQKVFVLCIFALSSYGPIWCLIYSKLWKCC